MATFLSVQGYDPGPSQRPFLAGAISGVLGTPPAILILLWCGSLKVEAQILRLSTLLTLAIGCVVMAAAGAGYARLFGRAANNRHGGWLFGLAFGFALWAGGAVLILPILCGGRAPAGEAAIGVAASMLAWGLAVGLLLPVVHRPLHEGLEQASRHAGLGPNAAANGRRNVRKHRRPPRR